MIPDRRVSPWQRVSLVGLIAAFVVMATMRLNDCDLFNPDSPRYVIYSQAIVNLGEYRATDLPGAPLYSWRPPGLSILLAPVMAIRPYDVIAAKIVILVCGSLLLYVLFQLTLLHCTGWPSILVTGVVATSPAFLVLSTEVLSEIPYSLGVLAVMYLLSRSEEAAFLPSETQTGRSRSLSLGVATIILTFTPWLRTAGVSLVLAIAVWSLVSRFRWKWLIPVISALAGLALLAWRNRQAAGENYVGKLFHRLREQGLFAIVASGLETIGFYLSAAPGLLLPGLTPQRTMFAPMTLDGLPNINLPFGVQASIAAIFGMTAIIGMWKRRSAGGSLAILYLVVYGGCLVVWPWRHERFLWPLVPVALAFVPAGLSGFGGCRDQQRGICLVGAASVLAFCCWQMTIGAQIVIVNRDFVHHRDAFHADRRPGFYFSNWRQAGTWLHDNSSRFSRVLTWHAAVAGTARRFQKRVQFETLSPDKIRQQIEQFSARYLVVPDAQFGDGFGWQQLTADPGLTMTVVYRQQDVAVLEVTPNRTGVVSKNAFSEWLDQQLRLVAESRSRMPDRIDLAIRQASLLRESGSEEQAIKILHELFDRGIVTARICAELGWMLFDAGEFAEAARFLDLARTQPNAESIADVLADGVARAKQRLRDAESGKSPPSIEGRLRRVKSLMNFLKYAAAEREADRLIAENPDDPEANFVRGKLHHRLSELSAAETCYENALRLGFKGAEEWLLLIRFDAAMMRPERSAFDVGSLHQEVDPANLDDHVRLASLLREHGWTGRALATLEQANVQFPEQTAIQIPLAELYRVFARPDLAISIYESILRRTPEDEVARKGLAATQWLLIEPAMGDPSSAKSRPDNRADTAQ